MIKRCNIDDSRISDTLLIQQANRFLARSPPPTDNDVAALLVLMKSNLAALWDSSVYRGGRHLQPLKAATVCCFGSRSLTVNSSSVAFGWFIGRLGEHKEQSLTFLKVYNGQTTRCLGNRHSSALEVVSTSACQNYIATEGASPHFQCVCLCVFIPMGRLIDL